jgi:AhpD family alkylhydroperoxidase
VLGNAATQPDLPETTVSLVELRTSQINGCGVCVDVHSRELKNAGDRATASQPSPAGGMSRISARPSAPPSDPVPGDVWDIAARHYTEAQLAALVLAITAINAWNRLNATTPELDEPFLTAASCSPSSSLRRPGSGTPTSPVTVSAAARSCLRSTT